MATHSYSNLSIVEAVETLSNIADLEFDREIGITQKHERILSHQKVTYKTVHWLHQKDASSTVNLVRETFRVILHYLKQFYKKEYTQVTDQKTLDEIKTIMILVGEAAKKLDRYHQMFNQKQRIMDLKEYQQLQEFYRVKIARKVEEGIINKWILGLTLGKRKAGREINFNAPPKPADKLGSTQHLFVDLETVKKDREYELFFIRKENGSRFFSSRLLRNIKLVCDFGTYFGKKKELDPLEHIKQWYDRTLHIYAKEIIKFLGRRLDHFFLEISQIQDHELIQVLNKAFLALMMSAHTQNLMRHHPSKTCAEYFEDFQGFLREALKTNIYQKWMTHVSKENNPLAFDLIDLVHTLCRALYGHLKGLEEMVPIIQELIQKSISLVSQDPLETAQISNKVWNKLNREYAAMSQLIQHHSNGPLLKILEMLEENVYQIFDPLLQHNIPNQLYSLYTQDKRYTFLRMAAPIHQEFINKAIVNEEFKGFLHSYYQGEILQKHLLINLQDRTSWREYARCVALEELQQQPNLKNMIHVVTLATDTDFYHQLTPYHQLHHADLFKEQFKELLLDQNTGYYFPPSIKNEDFSSFIDRAFEAIHRIFFSSKNVILRDNRLDFIEIFYWLLQLKLIEWIQPDTVSLTCKDSIDIGEAYSAGLFAFLKLIHDQEWTDADWEHLNFMIYAPSLFIRERVMLPERFNRMLSALKVVENARDEMGTENFIKIIQEDIGKLFNTPIAYL